MRAHLCGGECGPRRLYLHFDRGSLIIGVRTQLWLPRRGYTRWWSPVEWHPAHKEPF